jgi:hypothetical protein
VVVCTESNDLDSDPLISIVIQRKGVRAIEVGKGLVTPDDRVDSLICFFWVTC